MTSSIEPPQTSPTCACLAAPHGSLTLERELGMDERYAEVSLWRCPDCDRWWLKLLIEDEAFTASGRWYLGLVSAEQAARLTAREARLVLAGLGWYYYGGSYYNGRSGRTAGPIR